MKLSIVYITFRQRPRFEWFCSSLSRELGTAPELSPADVEVLVVDGRLWHDARARQIEFAALGRGYLAFEHLAPKPSLWQGPGRQTKREFFCAASARNTALAHARGDQVAFVDDLSILLPGWLKAHLDAAEHGYVLAGTTSKKKNLVVSADGDLLSFDEFASGEDSRLKMAGVAGGGLVSCSGGSLFGGTFSVPLELALAVNGQDEKCDTIGGEDYDFGIRLERAGASIRLSAGCGTFEDEDGHHTEAPMVRLDKPWPGPDGPYSSNYLLHRLLRERGRYWTIGNEFVLREVRLQVLSGGGFPELSTAPVLHWVDGQPLSEM